MSWYVIATPRSQELQIKHWLDNYILPPGFSEGKNRRFKTFLPLKKVGVTSRKDQNAQEIQEPVISGLIFVQSSKPSLDQWLNEVGLGCRYYTDVKDVPIIVPDFQIRLFKDYISFVNSDVMVLRKPYSYFLKKKKIRILNGPFAGLEGRLFQIKGNYKLVYGLGNTALALSDIAKYTYVEVTDEVQSQSNYLTYYNHVKSDLQAMGEEQASDREILHRLQHWRQEASILTMENPLVSSYVSIALQHVLADLYDKSSSCFYHADSLRVLKSLYLDTEDYLNIARVHLEDAEILSQLDRRLEQVKQRVFYQSDPFGFLQVDEDNPQDYAFIRLQENRYKQVLESLPTDQEKAFEILVTLFDDVADKLSLPKYVNHLDSTANYRVRKLLRSAAHLYRKCRDGRSEEFQQHTQQVLRRLLRRPPYQPYGFFDLLQAIRQTP